MTDAETEYGDHAVLALLAELLSSDRRVGRLHRLAGRLRHRRQPAAVSVLACVRAPAIVARTTSKSSTTRCAAGGELTIIPIRDTRRKLKGATTLVEPGKQEAFRNKVKAVELEAEQLQQEALYNFTKSGPLGAQGSPRAAARANIGAYERAVGANFPKGAVDLLGAAFDSIVA